MDRDGVEVHKHAQKGTRPISSLLDRTGAFPQISGYVLRNLEVFKTIRNYENLGLLRYIH